MRDYKIILRNHGNSPKSCRKQNESRVRSLNKKEIVLALRGPRWTSAKKRKEKTSQEKEALSMISTMKFLVRFSSSEVINDFPFIGKSYSSALNFRNKIHDEDFMNGLNNHIKRLLIDTVNDFENRFKLKKKEAS